MNVLLATNGPDETRDLAAALADVLFDGDLLVLTGDLGAGKTCFTQGLAKGLGIDDRVTSPTFTLANRYHGRLILNHLDVYRLDSVAESLDLGLTELLEDGVTVIEWGDRIEAVLPVDHLTIGLRYPELNSDAANGQFDDQFDSRVIEIEAQEGSSFAERKLATVLARWSADPAVAE